MLHFHDKFLDKSVYVMKLLVIFSIFVMVGHTKGMRRITSMFDSQYYPLNLNLSKNARFIHVFPSEY